MRNINCEKSKIIDLIIYIIEILISILILMDNLLFQKYIYYVIKNIFNNLNDIDLNLLTLEVYNIIDYITIKFGFKGDYSQFLLNDNQDIKSILNILIPFIDDKQGSYILHKSITKLKDISIKKDKSIIEKHINPYYVSNIQYDRELDDHIEYEYGEADIIIQGYLIKDTINVISNKLYVNWINIIPYNLDNYKSSNLWINSYKYNEIDKKFKIDNKDFIITSRESLFDVDYEGLHPYDYYNSIYHLLFKHVYNFKWLLYEKQFSKDSRPFVILEELNNLYPLQFFLDNILWDILSDEKRIMFEKSWTMLLNICNNVNQNSNIENIKKFLLFKNIVIHYQNYIIKKKKIIDEDEEKEDLDIRRIIDIREDYSVKYYENNEEKFLSGSELVESIKNINIKDIYNYLLITVTDFYKTWYGKKIINYDKKYNKLVLSLVYKDITYINNNSKYYLTFKNIYNFAKFICFNIKIDEARCLSLSDWNIFLKNLVGTNFSLNYTLKKVYGENINNKQLSREIATNICQNITEIIFETLIYQGSLSKFISRPNVTNKKIVTRKLLPSILKNVIFTKDNIKEFNKSYYYVNNDTFDTLISESSNKIHNYLDNITKGSPWFTFYAMDWIFQINFFNKFLNNRIILVTGATGQGKSTQIPKLLYYATKNILMIQNARVISTQPRRKPTIENSVTISRELGIPILINDIKTFNYYVQFSTQFDKHLSINQKTYIQEVTDKTLFDKIISNPLLKFDDLKTNIYDVIIIDEAHEHNINMDLIMTVIKSSLYYNNQIRFIITSATMDVDEPNYRLYFKDIDDNYLYPINQWFYDEKNNKINNKYKIDRIVCDRRVHISPPGQTTQYVITEYWQSKNPDTYKEAEDIAYNIALKIANSYTSGDILLFSIGEREIKNICMKLNNTLPTHVIALPFYSSLDIFWQDLITNPLKYQILNFDRNYLFDEINKKGSAPKKNNNFTMILIIATNVAEASLTINSLKFVIDTGFSKVKTYNPSNKSEKMDTERITERSRVQRKGRIGRVSDGQIYYTYAQDFTSNVKSKYSISNSDFTINLFQLNTTENQQLLYPSELQLDKISSNITFDDWKNKIGKKNPIRKIIKNQFTIKQIDFPYQYSGEDTIRRKNWNAIIPERYIDGGFDIDNIIDLNGTFYIIHPSEDLFLRDIKTRIPLTNHLNDKMQIFFNNAIGYRLLITDKFIKNPYFVEITKILPLFTNSNIISVDVELDSLSFINAFIHSIAYDCFDKFAKIICLYTIINKLNKQYKSYLSDLEYFDKLSQMIKIPDINLEEEKRDFINIINWYNIKDNSKWFKLPFEKETVNDYLSNIMNHLNTNYKEVMFKTSNIFNISNRDINKYFNNYIKLKTIIYDKLKPISQNIQIVKTNNYFDNIIKTLINAFPINIIKCQDDKWINIFDNIEYKPHNKHSITNLYGYYLYLTKDNENNPLILSKISDSWINEINYHINKQDTLTNINHIFYKSQNKDIYNKNKMKKYILKTMNI